jgi:hypothetical protein
MGHGPPNVSNVNCMDSNARNPRRRSCEKPGSCELWVDSWRINPTQPRAHKTWLRIPVPPTYRKPLSVLYVPNSITLNPMDRQPAHTPCRIVDHGHVANTGSIQGSIADAVPTTPSVASVQSLTPEQTVLYEALFSLFRRSLSHACDAKGEDYCRTLFSGETEFCKCTPVRMLDTGMWLAKDFQTVCDLRGTYINATDLMDLPSLLAKARASFVAQPLGFFMSLKFLLYHSECYYQDKTHFPNMFLPFDIKQPTYSDVTGKART